MADIAHARLHCMHRQVTPRVLKRFMKEGCKTRNQDESLFDYFKRMGKEDKAVKKFEKNLNKCQKELIENHPDGEGYDVTLLYKCLRFWCLYLADEHDDSRWNDPGDTFIEALITQTKNKRNSLSHQKASFTQQDLEDEAQELQRLLTKILERCKDLYKIPEQDIKQEIDAVISDIKSYKDDILESDIFQQYEDDRKKIISERVNTKGKRKLKKKYQKNLENTVSPLNHFAKIGPLPVEDVFMELEMKTSESSQSKQIIYRDILRRTQDPSVIVINGHAGFGKTTLIKKMIRDWIESTGSMEHLDEHDLLLKTECRSRKIGNFKELIKHLMPDIYKEFSPEDMKDTVLSQKMMTILDGIDELNSTSGHLFEQLLELKKDHEFPFMVTTRPEKMKYLRDQLKTHSLNSKIIKIKGVPLNKVNDFVGRYYSVLHNESSGAKNVQHLLDYLDKRKNVLEEILRSPYNLTLLTILFAFSDGDISQINTASRLYKEIIDLYTTKLEDRLKGSDDTVILDGAEKKRVVARFMYYLAKESVIALKDNCLTLPKEAYQRLDEICRSNKTQVEEMLGAFLQLTHGEEDIYEYPHKGLQEYLGAFFIWNELTHQGDIYKDEKRMESFLKWAHQEDIPPNQTHMMIKMMEEARQSSSDAQGLLIADSDPVGSFSVRKILKSLDISTGDEDFSKYQNTLKYLFGRCFLEGKVKTEDKDEIMYLIQKAGVNKRNDWIALLNDVELNDEAINLIVQRKKLLTGDIKIRDSSLMAYISLLRARKEPINDPSVNISVEIRDDTEEVRDLLRLIAHHSLRLRVLEVNKNNYKNIWSHLTAPAGPKSSPWRVTISLDEPTDTRTIKDILSFNYESEKVQLVIECLYKKPVSTDQAIKEAIDSILQRCGQKMEEYVGPMTDALPLVIPHLDWLYVGVCSPQDLSILSGVLQSHTHSLRWLRVCVPAEVLMNSRGVPLPHLNGVKGSEVSGFFPDVEEHHVGAVGDMARQLMPTHPGEGYFSLYFPRLHCTPLEVVQVMGGVRVREWIVFPSASQPRDAEEERLIGDTAEKNTGCGEIEWGGSYVLGEVLVNIDQW